MFVLIDGALVNGTLVEDLPDLGAITEGSSLVGWNAGTGRFLGAALRDFIVTELFDTAATVDSLTVTTTVDIGGSLDVTGPTTLAALTATSATLSGPLSGATTMGGVSLTLSGTGTALTLSAGGASILGPLSAGNTTANGTLHATGAVTADAALAVGTTLDVGANANITGAALIHGAGGLTVDHNYILSGVQSITGGAGTAALTLTQGGINVAGNLGNSGALAGWYTTNSGSGPATFGGGLLASITAAGNIVSPGFFAQSDVRGKTDIESIGPLEGELFVELARPVTYLKKGMHEAGFIAQEQVGAGYGRYVGGRLNGMFPEYVDEDGNIFAAGIELNLNYANYTAYLTACLKSLLERVTRLERLSGE